MMTSNPLSVSVVMATYNGKHYLAKQLESVLLQLLPSDELIIVDDGSQDGSLELIDALDSPLVRRVLNPQNLGVLATFERGLLMSSKEIVFLCDQDDVWLPGKRTAFVEAFEHDHRVLLVLSDAEIIDGSGAVIVPSFMATRGGFHGGVCNTLVKNRYLGCSMAMRRDLISAALPIPRSVPMHDMWLGIIGSAIGRIHYIATPFIQYRRHTGNVSPGKSQGFLRMLRWRVTLLVLMTVRLAAIKLKLR